MAQHDLCALFRRRRHFFRLRPVLTLLIPIRKAMKLENVVTIWHLDNLAKIVLFTSLIVTYSYMTESFTVWYTHDPIELATFHERYWGPQGYLFWLMILCNCLIPLLLLAPAVRTNVVWLFIISLFVNVGMWTERFVLIAGCASDEYGAVAMALLCSTTDRDRYYHR